MILQGKLISQVGQPVSWEPNMILGSQLTRLPGLLSQLNVQTSLQQQSKPARFNCNEPLSWQNNNHTPTKQAILKHITLSLSHFPHTKNVPLHLGRDHHLVPVFHVDLGLPVKLNRYTIHLVYAIESAAYGVIFTSCLCQRVRAFDTNK